MADAFGDDLFSVFDDEQTTSIKKKPASPAPQTGYVTLRWPSVKFLVI